VRFVTCGHCGIAMDAGKAGIVPIGKETVFLGKMCPVCKNGNTWVEVTDKDMYYGGKEVHYPPKRGNR
jgi:hypothetical protein